MPMGQSTVGAIFGGEVVSFAIDLFEQAGLIDKSDYMTKRFAKGVGAAVGGGVVATLTLDVPGTVGTALVTGYYLVSDGSLAGTLLGADFKGLG